jgi:hypothetical protein
MVDPGVVGSPTDVATLIVVAIGLFRTQQKLKTVAAGQVAIARDAPGVDDERIQSELDVDDRHVEAVRSTRTDGGPYDDR